MLNSGTLTSRSDLFGKLKSCDTGLTLGAMMVICDSYSLHSTWILRKNWPVCIQDSISVALVPVTVILYSPASPMRAADQSTTIWLKVTNLTWVLGSLFGDTLIEYSICDWSYCRQSVQTKGLITLKNGPVASPILKKTSCSSGTPNLQVKNIHTRRVTSVKCVNVGLPDENTKVDSTIIVWLPTKDSFALDQSTFEPDILTNFETSLDDDYVSTV